MKNLLLPWVIIALVLMTVFKSFSPDFGADAKAVAYSTSSNTRRRPRQRYR